MLRCVSAIRWDPGERNVSTVVVVVVVVGVECFSFSFGVGVGC